MATFHTGHRDDPPEVVARRVGFHFLKARRGLGVAPLPLGTNNRQFLQASAGGPGILNQKDTGSCEGFTHASGTTLRFAILRTPIPLVSPIAIYDGARIVSRGLNPDGTIPALSDDGTEPSLVFAAMRELGVASAAGYGKFPASSATVNQEPTLAMREADQAFTLDGAYFITSSGDQYVRDVMTALAAGFPVSAAIAASGATFQGYTGGILGPLDNAVDHATLWVDYVWDGQNLASVTVFGVNSWGEDDWGESDAPGIGGGMYRCNRDFIAKYSGSTAVLNVSKREAA